MAEKITVHPSEGSPQAIAFKLLEKIIEHDTRRGSEWTKDIILDTFAEALQAANGFSRSSK